MKINATDMLCFKHLELDFTAPGVSFVCGENRVGDYAQSNGSGKTSTLLCLGFGLFGKFAVAKDSRRAIRQDAKKALCEIEFQSVSGHRVWLKREVSATFSRLWLSVNDEPERQVDLDPGRKEIETYLGIDCDSWWKLLHYDSKNSLIDMTDAKLKETLTSMLPVDYTAPFEPLGVKLKEQNQLHGRLVGAREVLSASVDSTNQRIEQLGRAAKAWEADLAEKVSGLQEAAAEATRKADEYQASVAAWEAANSTGTEGIEQLTQQEREAWRAVLNLESSLTAETSAKNVCHAQEREEPPSQVCGTCLQSLPAAEKAMLMEQYSARIAQASHTAARHAENILEIQGKIAKAKAEHESITQQLAQLRATASAYEQERAGYYSGLSTLQAAAQTAHNAVQQAQAQNPHALAEAEARKSLLVVQEKRAKCFEDISAAEKAIANIEYARLLAGKSGLSHWVLSFILPALNGYIADVLTYMSGSDMTASFALTGRDQQKISLTASSKTGGNSLSRFSTGEKRRVEAAVFLAVRELSHQLIGAGEGFMVLDELLDHGLDRLGQESLLEAIANYARSAGRSVLVISNNQEILSDRRHVDRVVKVIKEADGSHVEVI